MPSGERLVNDGFNNGESYAMAEDLQVMTVSLGAGNEGSFGPGGVNVEKLAEISAANRNPEYTKPASNRWICVDGRVSDEEWQADDSQEADPQIAAGIAISETAADLMLNDRPQPLSITVANKTREAIADGLEVTTHGANGNKKGCAANADSRYIAGFNAANVDIIAPIVRDIAEALHIGEHVTNEDIVAMIVRGKDAADRDDLYDVTPEQVVDIIVASGGSYVDLKDEHHEKKIRPMLRRGAFAKAKFIKDLSNDNELIEQFAASFGEYTYVTFERAKTQNKPVREAALQVAAVVAFNIGVCKHLSTEDMEVDLIL